MNIDRPGIYDIPIDVYHSQKCCAGPSISSTGLRQIEHECPARFFAFSDLNPDPYTRKKSEALSFGAAAHALMLGEPAFDARFVVAPKDSFSSNPGRSWHEDHKDRVSRGLETRIIVRPADLVVIKSMVTAQRAEPEVANAFVEGEPEKSLIWQDKETGIWLKARPDWLPHEPAMRLAIEYKTTETLQPRRLGNAVFDYGYHMQAAMCIDGIAETFGGVPKGLAHIVQEKEPPYLAELKLFAPDQLKYGQRLYRRSLRTFADCLHHGKWPGWTHGPAYFETPYYIARSMENFNDERTASTGFSGAEYLETF